MSLLQLSAGFPRHGFASRLAAFAACRRGHLADGIYHGPPSSQERRHGTTPYPTRVCTHRPRKRPSSLAAIPGRTKRRIVVRRGVELDSGAAAPPENKAALFGASLSAC